ncbi:MAG: hypothetical protein WCE21_04505 [Candidatus Babeliales bacterium]
MTSSIIWGTVLILIGLSLIMKALFGIDIPFVRLALAGMFIYLGVTMITEKPLLKKNKWQCHWNNNTADEPNCRTIDVTLAKRIIEPREYNDMQRVRINTVFGKTILKLDPAIPTKITAKIISGSATFPDGNMVSFGEVVYFTHPGVAEQLVIETKTIFGALEIE